MEYPKHEIEWNFPMPFWRFTLPDSVELNKNITKRVYEKEDEKGQDRHQDVLLTGIVPGGYIAATHVESDIQFSNADGSEFDDSMMLPFLKFYANAVAEITKGSAMEKKDYEILLWSNLNRPGDSNVIHSHPGVEIGGVYYVKFPEGDCGQTRFYHPYYYPPPPAIPLAPPTVSPLETHVGLKGKEGQAVFFRTLLMHDVGRNNTQEDRITLSWNIRFKDNQKATHLKLGNSINDGKHRYAFKR